MVTAAVHSACMLDVILTALSLARVCLYPSFLKSTLADCSSWDCKSWTQRSAIFLFLFLLDIENYQLTCFFFKKFFYFIFDCAGSSLLCAGFPSCRKQGPLFIVVCGLRLAVAFLVVDRRPRCAQASGVAVRGLSSCGSRALECWLSSVAHRLKLPCGTCSLPGSGMGPMCPGL